ncbi:hypothetical protein [Sedimenticola selenatireducens]|uniref:hypothetical protein n=1 Tax=Sedimenticola selenatireducens TaxID=191960 RepID=UPI002AABE188|nr:hypothetical protein [Sedimenticola selenatireducens]
MKSNLIAILIYVSSSLLVNAESRVWLGAERNDWEHTEYRKVENDFGGSLVITSDLNWQQKWETPPDNVPPFAEAETVRVGEGIVILTFFVNPKVNEYGQASVRCALKVTRPDGTEAANYESFWCLNDTPMGDINNVRLSPAIINFIGEESDPLGEWVVEVNIHDVLRNTELNLRRSFTLEPRNG